MNKELKKYIGTKLVNATPMTLGDYSRLQGRTPVGQDPRTEGYLVEYTDGGKPNHPNFTGYISWSPKDVFEKSYSALKGLTFGQALEAMRVGKKVRRADPQASHMVYDLRESGKIVVHITPAGMDYGVAQLGAKEVFATDWEIVE